MHTYSKTNALFKEARKKRWFALLLKILTLILVLIPMIYLVSNLINNWQEAREILLDINILTFCLSITILSLAFALLPLGCQKSLKTIGISLSYPTTLKIYFLSQVSKYMPGGLWIVPGRIIAFGNEGIGVISSSTSMVIELSFMIITGIVLFIPYLIFTDNGITVPVWIYGFLLMPIIILLFPSLLKNILLKLLKLTGYRHECIEFSKSNLIALLSIYFLFWLLTGGGFLLLAVSISPLFLNQWLALLSSYSMAWILGFLAFLTPGGLGVREGAIVWLLTPFIPLPFVSILALLSRLWWVIVELMFILLSLIVGRGIRSNKLSSQE